MPNCVELVVLEMGLNGGLQGGEGERKSISCAFTQE